MALHTLTSRERSPEANRTLAAVFAFTAGTVDVTGFLAFDKFTTHVSGLVAFLAAAPRHERIDLILAPGSILLSFLAGAAFSALYIGFLRRHLHESEYAQPILLEAVLLAMCWLILGPAHWLVVVSLLAFCMGLQNATITKMSDSQIRTTHMTAMVTDIGIHIGQALYWNRDSDKPAVRADRKTLYPLAVRVSLFFAGGLYAALAFPAFGFGVLLPLAAILALLTVQPVYADLRGRS